MSRADPIQSSSHTRPRQTRQDSGRVSQTAEARVVWIESRPPAQSSRPATSGCTSWPSQDHRLPPVLTDLVWIGRRADPNGDIRRSARTAAVGDSTRSVPTRASRSLPASDVGREPGSSRDRQTQDRQRLPQTTRDPPKLATRRRLAAAPEGHQPGIATTAGTGKVSSTYRTTVAHELNRVLKLSSSYRNPMVKHEPELHT